MVECNNWRRAERASHTIYYFICDQKKKMETKSEKETFYHKNERQLRKNGLAEKLSDHVRKSLRSKIDLKAKQPH